MKKGDMEYSQYTNYTFNQLCAQIEYSHKLTEHQRVFVEGDKVYIVRGAMLYVATDGEEFDCIGNAEVGCPVNVPERITGYLYSEYLNSLE